MTDVYGFEEQTARKLKGIADANDRPTVVAAQKQHVFLNGVSFTVRNDSDETVPAYGCMRITGAEFDTGLNRYLVAIDKPNGETGRFLFNGPYEIEVGGLGQGMVEIVQAYYAAGESPTFGQYWGPDLDWFIEPTGHPAIEVYGDLENQKLYGRALRGEKVKVKVKPTNDVSPGNAIECTVFAGYPSAATTQTIPEVFLEWESGQEQISSGKEATAEYDPRDGVWRFVSAECETDQEPASKITSSTDSATPGTDSTAAAHINNDGVFLNDGNGTFTNVTAPPP